MRIRPVILRKTQKHRSFTLHYRTTLSLHKSILIFFIHKTNGTLETDEESTVSVEFTISYFFRCMIIHYTFYSNQFLFEHIKICNANQMLMSKSACEMIINVQKYFIKKVLSYHFILFYSSHWKITYQILQFFISCEAAYLNTLELLHLGLIISQSKATSRAPVK